MNAGRPGGDVKNVLLVVRRERDMDWAVNFVIHLHRRDSVRIHLLSVQTPFDGHVRMFFDDATIRAFHIEDGEAAADVIRAGEAFAQPFPRDADLLGFGRSAGEFERAFHPG